MEIPDAITGDLQKKHRKPWWVAVVTTVVMALGGASGAILNYLDNRDARRMAVQEAKAEGAVNAVWIQEQISLYDKEIASLRAAHMVHEAKFEGLAKRMELLERRSGRSAVRASRQLRIPVPDEGVAKKAAEKALREKRPPKPSRKDPAVQQLLKVAE